MLPGPWPGRSWRGVSWGQGVAGGARGLERMPLGAGPVPTLPAADWSCPMHTRETVDTNIPRSRTPDPACPFTVGPGLLVSPEGPWSGQRGPWTRVQAWARPSPRVLVPSPVPTSWTWAGGRAWAAAPVCPRGLPPVTRVTLPVSLWLQGLLCSRAVLSTELDSGGVPVEKQQRPGPGCAERGSSVGTARVPEGETSGGHMGLEAKGCALGAIWRAWADR